jgi:hypothetical protein
LKINQTVKEKVGSILSDGKVLLRLALDSLIQSIRNEPVKYSCLIYYNMSLTTTDFPVSDKYSSSQDHYYIEYYTAMLLNEAEKLYNGLVEDLTNRIIYDAASSEKT